MSLVPGRSGAAGGFEFPRMVRVRQTFEPTPQSDLLGGLRDQLAGCFQALSPGVEVGVAVGSRGISGLRALVETVVRQLEAVGARPFVIPAMGSHGGATPEGQRALLAEYGVTEAGLGVPIRASMEVREVGRTAEGFGVVTSVEAARADHLVILNRVKPHTDFAGGIGSGLIKMTVVGLGKQVGASSFHRAAIRLGFEVALRAAGRLVLERLPVLCGVAILENQRHETARVEVVRPEDFEVREAQLCAQARAWMPRLPFAEIDLLIVDWMGKNISGTGMDPTVIGRMIHGYSLTDRGGTDGPWVRRLFVRDLTPESHGNAIGIGMADFTSGRLVRAMDYDATVTNSLTALSLQGAKVPIHFERDDDAVRSALTSLGLGDVKDARVVRIRDTLSLEEFQISESLRNSHLPANLVVEGAPFLMTFGHGGELV